jgi:tetratricopeptide (TPR) repeat protein
MKERTQTMKWKRYMMGAAILLMVVVAYLPAVRGGFIWDDDAHVTKPALQSLHGLWRIWFEVGATQQYYPVLHSAFWLEHRLWGDAAPGYHLLNVLLHATAACLFVAVLRRLAVPGAWLAGMIFALHPVCVESVAWISEQKNTLSTVFYLAGALAYLGWKDSADGPSARGEGRSRFARPGQYWLATGLFVLAWLTKSVTATLPAALLVVFWWRRGRLSWREDVVPLLPWFALGVTAGLFTAWVERVFIIGPQGMAFDLNVIERCLLAGRAVWFYLGKLAWPADLIFIYPRWEVNAGAWGSYLFPAGLLVLAGALGWMAHKGTRGPLAAFLYFCGTLFPALGFFNIYPFIFSYVADHFQYLASLGPIALAAAVTSAPVAGQVRRLHGTGAVWRSGVAAGVVCVLGALTWRQCGIYRDVQTLYAATLERNPQCWLVHHNLGNLLLDEGKVAEAIAHYDAALRQNPNNPDIHFNLGKALNQEGRNAEAVPQFQAVLRLSPTDAEAHDNLGVAFLGIGRTAEAMAEFEAAIRLRPENAIAHYNLGVALRALGRPDEARAEFEAAARLGVRP